MTTNKRSGSRSLNEGNGGAPNRSIAREGGGKRAEAIGGINKIVAGRVIDFRAHYAAVETRESRGHTHTRINGLR